MKGKLLKVAANSFLERLFPKYTGALHQITLEAMCTRNKIK